MNRNRKYESGQIPARGDRIFKQHNYWYFKTREGMDIGPFDSMDEAIKGIQEFIEFVTTTQPEVVNRISEYVNHAA